MQKTTTSDQEITLALMEMMQLFRRVFDAKIRDFNSDVLPPHLATLQILCDQPMSQVEISKHLMIGAPTVSATLNLLEKRGWVKRERPLHDKRVVLIHITPEGKDVLDNVRKNAISIFMPSLGDLNEEERQIILSAIILLNQKIIQKLQTTTE
jgi:DNA-binding MarR family transcriptional regulator